MTSAEILVEPPQEGSAVRSRGRAGNVAWWIAKRLAAAVAVMFGAATLAFIALQLIPGDPVDALLGPNSTASPSVRAQITADYGFDRPVIAQYLSFVGRLARGDLGVSYQLQRPVSTLIGDQVGESLQLLGAGFALALVGAVIVAVATAGRRRRLRRFAVVAELLAVSSPQFWTGILLLTVFSFQLHVFSVADTGGVGALVLPAITLALPVGGVMSQILRESLEAALAEPFTVTARARGLGQTAVRLRHGLRHAALPLSTLVGWLTGLLLSSTVVIEVVFGRPGVGSLAVQAVTDRDVPLLTGVVLLSAFVFVLVSTALDALYLVIDPRLRTE